MQELSLAFCWDLNVVRSGQQREGGATGGEEKGREVEAEPVGRIVEQAYYTIASKKSS